MTQFVDSNHAGDTMNHRSHMGILIYLSRALIIWYIKKQNTVESNKFISEILSMQTRMDPNKDLRYTIRMMGISIDGPTLVFCDKKLVVTSTFVLTSTFLKKHLGICDHMVR